MTFNKLVINSLLHSFWLNTALALGVTIATAVLSGSLIIGDSMRGSLKEMALSRLGNVDSVFLGTHFWESRELCSQNSAHAILIPAAVQYGKHTIGIQLLGLSDEAYRMTGLAEPPNWQRDEIEINEALAKKLGLEKDAVLSLRLAKPELIPQDSLLGRKQDTLLRFRLRVNRIGDVNFSLKMNQQPEPIAVVPLKWLQNKLELENKINAVLQASGFRLEALGEDVASSLLPIVVDSHENHWTHIKAERMLFTESQANALLQALQPNASSLKPTLIHLAESIATEENKKSVPYSTIAGIDAFGLAEDEIAINRWTADELNAKIGDAITLTFFEPESVYGQTKTQTASFRLAKILEMEGLAADPLLVPEMKGVSDAKAISDWNPPFPFDAKKIRKLDEDYWETYKTSPKAFVAYETAKRLWGSRFGNVTAFVIEAGGFRQEALGEDRASFLQPNASSLMPLFGFSLIPIRQQSIAASVGTTPFQILFISFSFFIIAAALMLVALLFRLSIEQRKKQIKILSTVGWTRFQTTKLLCAEGGIVAFTGAILGLPLGIAFAAAMLYGLQTYWIAAISVPFLKLHWTGTSLAIGFFSGFLLSLGVVVFSLREPRRVVADRLHSKRLFVYVQIFIVAVLFIFGFFAKDEITRAGVFFGTGTLVLVFSLLFIRRRLINVETPVNSLAYFAFANAGRNPTRSILCIGLISSTLFLVLSISVFRLNAAKFADSKYSLILETQLPIYFDLNTSEGRDELGMQKKDAAALDAAKTRITSMRVRSGDDASCQNLYPPKNPRILAFSGGQPSRLSYRQDACTQDSTGWKPVLQTGVTLDANTAMYSLHLYGGVGETFEIEDGGQKLQLKVAALLQNSIFQGDILMNDEQFEKLFPDVSGYRFFLVETENPEMAASILTETLGEYGLNIETAEERLGRFFSVQNTYISTFQSLGGFGLLLGTFGIGIVAWRNILERRREIAMLQAVGYTRNRILALLSIETLFLLGCGLGIAILASVFATPTQFGNILLWQEAAKMTTALFAIGLLSSFIAFCFISKINIRESLSMET